MTDRPSLLLISERFAPDLGGVARSATRTALALRRSGIDVHVLAWTRTLQPGELCSTMFGDEPDGKVNLHRLGLFANWDLSMQHSLNVLEWLHSRYQFQGVWGHYIYPAGFMAVLFAETVGLPSTVSARGNDIDRLMFPPGDFARLTWTLDRSTVVSAVSQDLVSKIDLLLGRSTGAVVLGNVVDAAIFRPVSDSAAALRTKFGIADDEAVLGFCGELRHKKGMPFLLQSLAEVHAVRPARLLVIGDVRPREQSTISSFLLDHVGLSDQITVTGHVDDPVQVAGCLQLCDVVLQQSVWDGLPNAILEAMACERIVIASDAGGIPEVISHRETGFVVPRSQLHRLGEAILEVLALPTHVRAEIGQRARCSITEQFHPGVEADRLREITQRMWSDQEPHSTAADE